MMMFFLQQTAIGEVTDTAVKPVEGLVSSMIEAVGNWTPKILGAVLALIIGLWIVALLTGWAKKALKKTKMDESLRPFLVTVINFSLKVVLFLGIAQMLGFGITSFAAILVGVGAAIGGAFNGSLGNIASGVMLLIFRPFKVNDLIELPDGTLGFVKEISVFVTILETFQNKTEIVPNAAITAGKITNYTTKGNLRVDIPFGIRYGADVEKAQAIVTKVLEEDKNVLKDPAFSVVVNNLGQNGVELLALPFTSPDTYWDVYWGTRQNILSALGEAGFEAPLPQRLITQL